MKLSAEMIEEIHKTLNVACQKPTKSFRSKNMIASRKNASNGRCLLRVLQSLLGLSLPGTVGEVLTGDNIGDAILLWQANPTAAEELYGAPIEEWDTSKVEFTDSAFQNSVHMTADLSAWDVTKVTSMYYMFNNSKDYSAIVNTWNTSQVLDISYAFVGVKQFSADVSSWDVSSVTAMIGLFEGSHNFSADLSGWTTPNLLYIGSAFARTENFSGDLSGWDLSSVEPLNALFLSSTNFNGKVSTWDTSGAVSMFQLFAKSENFSSDVGTWDVSSVENMQFIFGQSKNFRANLTSWDTAQVKSLAHAFLGSDNCAADVSTWDVSSATSMAWTFAFSTNLSSDVSSWDTSKVEDFSLAFYNASGFNTSICWDLSSADPLTLTRFSCFSHSSFDCSCNSLDPSNGEIEYCTIINSECPEATPACMAATPGATNFCAVDETEEADDTFESMSRRGPAGDTAEGKAKGMGTVDDVETTGPPDLLLDSTAFSGGLRRLPWITFLFAVLQTCVDHLSP